MKPTRVTAIDPDHWSSILRESLAEGHNMIRRLLSDFRSGVNRFNAPGEILYAHFSGQVPIAVCGLNRETDPRFPRSGRIRRLYVVPRFRRKGLARTLVDELIQHAVLHFDTLTVNVGKAEAREFYEGLGFVPVHSPTITHVLSLTSENTSRE